MSDPRREAVWLALSELWRDIELDAASLETWRGYCAAAVIHRTSWRPSTAWKWLLWSG